MICLTSMRWCGIGGVKTLCASMKTHLSLVSELIVYHPSAFLNKLRALKGRGCALLILLFPKFLNSRYSIFVK